MPDSGVRTAIEAEAAKVDWEERLGDAVDADVFRQELPERVASFKASAEVRTGARESREGRASVATREYTGEDKSELRIKVTDTAEVGSLRSSLRDQLTVMGSGTSGDQTGAMLAGHPGIVAYDQARRVSRAVMLVRGRFLIEAMVRNTDKPEAAREAVEALPVIALTKADKRSEKQQAN